jgi:dipeptidyl-peptidase II
VCLFFVELTCFSPYDQYIQCADITGCGLGPDSMAWDFQACTEIALYDDTHPTERDMFPYLPQSKSSVDKYCLAQWNVTRADKQLDVLEWGEKIKWASNIIFANGNLDPWSLGGVLHNVSNSLIALMVQGGAHHLDLRESHPKDPPSVREVREAQKTIISKWLKDAK